MSTDAPDLTETSETPAAVAAPDRLVVTAGRHLAVQESPEFAGLRRALRGFVFPMTAVFFLWYALFVILSGYARGFMSLTVIGNINVALIFGLLQFASTFLIAWLYSRYAERRIDPIADRMRAELEATGAQR